MPIANKGISLREHINGQAFEQCLEIGCGTGMQFLEF